MTCAAATLSNKEPSRQQWLAGQQLLACLMHHLVLLLLWRACESLPARMQVIPIYGRGGDNSDPRQMSPPAKPEDQNGPVPNRPPGQRMAPVQVIMACLLLSGNSFSGPAPGSFLELQLRCCR